jgi:opacity protein-like surface antigen
MITKKSYITGIAIVILTSSALAEDRTGLYFKANVGANKMNSTKQHNVYPEENVYVPSNKSKSKISPAFNIAAGFYLNNLIRHDLSFGYQKVNFENNTVYNNRVYDEHGNIIGNADITLNRKSSIYLLMFNSYVDLPINNRFNFFFGGGIGIGQIKEKVIQKIIANNINVSEGKEKSKNRRNFAYSLTTGISLKVSDKANFEVTYSWQDFGKTKYKDKDITKNRYNGHSIMTGVRFDV